jgi:hypothetical protein
MSHTLTESGKIEFYDIHWNDGVIEEHIPYAALDLTEGKNHSHKASKSDDDKKDKEGS